MFETVLSSFLEEQNKQGCLPKASISKQGHNRLYNPSPLTAPNFTHGSWSDSQLLELSEKTSNYSLTYLHLTPVKKKKSLKH
jgi:hypothetical protein